MSEVVDLDALAPKPVTIKFGGEEIQIHQLSTGEIFKIGEMTQRMGNVKTEAETDQAAQALEDYVRKVIPGLPAGQKIGIKQLMKLVSIITDMAIPADAKELAARNISLGSGSPKAPASPPSTS